MKDRFQEIRNVLIIDIDVLEAAEVSESLVGPVPVAHHLPGLGSGVVALLYRGNPTEQVEFPYLELDGDRGHLVNEVVHPGHPGIVLG